MRDDNGFTTTLWGLEPRKRKETMFSANGYTMEECIAKLKQLAERFRSVRKGTCQPAMLQDTGKWGTLCTMELFDPRRRAFTHDEMMKDYIPIWIETGT